jgi:hypothetical protein
MPIDVRESPELQAAIIALRRMRSDLRPALYKEARVQVGGLWLPALRSRASTLLEQRVMLPGARVKTSATGFSVLAANSNKKLRGGLVPSINSNWAGAEFGAKEKPRTYQRRSVLGRTHSVTRTVGSQWRSRVKDGRIAFDAASEIGTKLVAVWVVVVVTQIRDAARGQVV